MPELVANGPNVPVSLMNEFDNGRVVFFCGAGISKSSGLPDFPDLVDHVYSANRMTPDSVERAALDRDGKDPALQRPNFDKALGLLERPERLGAIALRRTVVERLSKPPKGSLDVHTALIALSGSGPEFRMVTTNFDNRFVQAGLEEERIDCAPKLPVPNSHRWSSLVHLHGRIFKDDDGSDLILTAGDFGRAYLTERWAARFVTELFRNFTVVFVGYSVSDPVMSYMVDALAAERARGGQFTTAYAFAESGGSTEEAEGARDQWRAKNVIPMRYDSSANNHRLLAETLIEWERISRDLFQARSRIAVNAIKKIPAGADDPVVERVVWALQNSIAAQALADEPPIKEEHDFIKVETWLELFAEKGLLRCIATDATTGESGSSLVRLVHGGYQYAHALHVDSVRRHLARWIARNLHIPQVFGWVVRNGGHMHPELRQRLRVELAERESDIPSGLRTLWTVILDYEPVDPNKLLWLRQQYDEANSEIERRCLEDQAVRSVEPRLIVRPGPFSSLLFRQYLDDDAGPITPIEASGHLELVLREQNAKTLVEDVFDRPEVLARHAETLTLHLYKALALNEHIDERKRASFLYRPSIAEHDQNFDREDWTYLIDLVRDSYFALANSNRAQADILLHRWAVSSHLLFRRLALHAVTEDTMSDIQIARDILFSGPIPGIWEPELRREVLRFSRLSGSRLPRSFRTKVVGAIEKGPRPKSSEWISDDPAYIRREKAIRLNKLSASGVRLDENSSALAETADSVAEGVAIDRDEFLMWHGKGRVVGEEERGPQELLDGPVDKLAASLEDASISPGDFRSIAYAKPVKAIAALRRASGRGVWPGAHWQQFLWSYTQSQNQPNRRYRLQEHVARTLATANDELFASVGSPAAGFVKILSEVYGTEKEEVFGVLWSKCWAGVSGSAPDFDRFDGPLTSAMNDSAGILAEAALVRLQKRKPRLGSGLTDPIRPYFDAIGKDPNGQLGRVILATRLNYLLAIDPDWTKTHLIPRLMPGSSDEANSLWSSFCWSPKVGPDLLDVFKESFLAMLHDGAEVGPTASGLPELFVSICLEMPGALTDNEIQGVIDRFSEHALESALGRLTEHLTVDQSQKKQIWQDKVHPWLQQYWPSASARNTEGITMSILELLGECGEAFSEAADWAIPYLKTVMNGESLYRLSQYGYAKQHPSAVLQVLDSVVGNDGFPSYQRVSLREILDQLKNAAPNLATTRQFRRLYQLAAR